MRTRTIRAWSWTHKWSSLVSTLFLLMLCVTGLPLIFHHEPEHLLGDAAELREMPPGTPHLDLQQLVLKAEQHRPGEVMQYFGYEEDQPDGVVAITAATAGTEPNLSHTFMLDARTGEAVAMPAANGGFMMLMLRLHVDMFAGLPGKLLLAFMGVLFVVVGPPGAGKTTVAAASIAHPLHCPPLPASRHRPAPVPPPSQMTQTNEAHADSTQERTNARPILSAP